MRDVFTWFAILGAAVSFALYLALRYTRQIAGFADTLSKVRRARHGLQHKFYLVLHCEPSV